MELRNEQSNKNEIITEVNFLLKSRKGKIYMDKIYSQGTKDRLDKITKQKGTNIKLQKDDKHE